MIAVSAGCVEVSKSEGKSLEGVEKNWRKNQASMRSSSSNQSPQQFSREESSGPVPIIQQRSLWKLLGGRGMLTPLGYGPGSPSVLLPTKLLHAMTADRCRVRDQRYRASAIREY